MKIAKTSLGESSWSGKWVWTKQQISNHLLSSHSYFAIANIEEKNFSGEQHQRKFAAGDNFSSWWRFLKSKIWDRTLFFATNSAQVFVTFSKLYHYGKGINFKEFCYFLDTSIACQSGPGLISKRRKLRVTQHNSERAHKTSYICELSLISVNIVKIIWLCDSKGKVPQSKDASSPKNRLHPLWSTEVEYLWTGKHFNLHIQLWGPVYRSIVY